MAKKNQQNMKVNNKKRNEGQTNYRAERKQLTK